MKDVMDSNEQDLTAELNRVLAQEPQERHPFIDAAAAAMLRRTEWEERAVPDPGAPTAAGPSIAKKA
jgi:hypothetical protein